MSYILVTVFLLAVAYALTFPQDIDLNNLIKTCVLVGIIAVILNWQFILLSVLSILP